MNPKNLVEETLMKISSLEVSSIRALFALVASPEAETLLRGINETSSNLETLEMVCYTCLHLTMSFYLCGRCSLHKGWVT